MSILIRLWNFFIFKNEHSLADCIYCCFTTKCIIIIF